VNKMIVVLSLLLCLLPSILFASEVPLPAMDPVAASQAFAVQQYQVPTPSCPEGYTFNEEAKACIGKPSCPPGGDYNPKTKKCESQVVSVTCPPGMEYDKNTDTCFSKPIR